ncbi:hypothetical protein EZV62_010931 [Acer yangbiense]|uniref:Piwi domain-containing protein n=1 Tax=Acer yangbiense TaxID=1000413 RepID=A0A5C7I3T4_9ROSI|nr:hypothetical protein EZV62_010931 [Acer yangbiense]
MDYKLVINYGGQWDDVRYVGGIPYMFIADEQERVGANDSDPTNGDEIHELREVFTSLEDDSDRDGQDACGTTIEKQLTEVDGRILEAPKLKVGNDEDCIPRDGRWNFNNKEIERFFTLIEEEPQSRRVSPVATVERMAEMMKSKVPGPSDFILCVLLERKNSDIYAIEHSSHIPLIKDAPTLILGMDVSHGSPASIAAVVGSQCWLRISRYSAYVRMQSSKMELIYAFYKPLSNGTDDGILRGNKNLTGTARYASCNTHLRIEQSRRDYLESPWLCTFLFYERKGIVIDFLIANQNVQEPRHLDRLKARKMLKKLRVKPRLCNMEYKILGLGDKPCNQLWQKPQERMRTPIDAVRNYRYDLNHVLSACCITVEKQLIEVDGRILEAPKLKVGNNEDCIPHDGRWNFNKQGPVIDFLIANQNVQEPRHLDRLKARKMLKKLRVKPRLCNMEYKILGLGDKPCNQLWQKPQERMRTPIDAVRNYRYDLNHVLSACCITVEKQLIEVDGRILEAPKLKVGNNEDCIPHDGRWNFNKQGIVIDFLIANQNVQEPRHLDRLKARKMLKKLRVKPRLCNMEYKILGLGDKPCNQLWQKPQERMRTLIDAVRNYRYDVNHVLSACCITVEKQLIEVDGRILEAPKLKVGNNEDCIPHDGRWNFNKQGIVIDFLIANQNVQEPRHLDRLKARKMLKKLRVKPRLCNMEYKILGLGDKPCNQLWQKPQERMRTLIDAVRNYRYDLNHFLSACCITVEKQLIEVDGRILKAPKLKVGNNEDCIPHDGRWNFNKQGIVIDFLIANQNVQEPRHLDRLKARKMLKKLRVKPRLCNMEYKILGLGDKPCNQLWQKPQERMRTLIDAVRNYRYDLNHFLSACCITVEKQLIEVDGRILKAPKLKVGNNEDCIPHDGRWNFNKQGIVIDFLIANQNVQEPRHLDRLKARKMLKKLRVKPRLCNMEYKILGLGDKPCNQLWQKPQERMRTLIDAVRNYRYDVNHVLSACCITVEKQLIEVDGRILKAPKMAEITHVDVVWPGWGHASENTKLPRGNCYLTSNVLSSYFQVKISSESCLSTIQDKVYKEASVFTTEEAI